MLYRRTIHLFAISCGMLLLLQSNGFSQSRPLRNNILFYQLSTADGLTDNYINDLCTDRGGNLWIATGEGLNMFNGTRVIKFFQRDYPQLQSNGILQLVCDRMNRIWVLTDTGRITLIDEQRRFHRVGLYEGDKPVEIRSILLIRGQPVLLADRQQWAWPPENRLGRSDSLSLQQFKPLKVPGFDSLLAGKFRRVKAFDSNSYIFSVADGFYKINYQPGQVEKKIPAAHLSLIGRWDQNQLLAYDGLTREPVVIDLMTHAASNPLKNLLDQYGELLQGPLTNVARIRSSQLLLTTQGNGIYIYDLLAHQLVHHRHNAADQTTLVNNSPRAIALDSTGWVFLGATPHGLSYFKSNAVIGQQAVFLDKQGNSYDGYITAIYSPDRDTYYIGTSTNILKWKRSTNTTEFIGSANPPTANLPARYLTLDKAGRIWAGVEDLGLFVYDSQGRLVKHLQKDSSGRGLPANFIQHILPAPDGWMWISMRTGICRVNPADFSVDRFEGTGLDTLRNITCISTWFADTNRVWIGTRAGAWQYNTRTHQLDHYTKKQGLPNDEVLCFNKDRFNNVYIGTVTGLQIRLHNGRTIQIDTGSGLLNKRVEALLLDKHNRMWIGNDVALACFNIRDTSVTVFDERYGLSVQGFRINAYCQNADDELIWGTERGLQFFYPDDLLRQKVDLPTTITRMESRDVVSDMTEDAIFYLSSSDNYVSFYFSSIDYSKHLQTFYAYKLEGIDEDWVHVADQNFVRYSSLPAGKYIFKVRASNDNRTWEPAANQVTVVIAPPIWQTAGFRIAVAACVLLTGWWLVRSYKKRQQKQREEMETQLVVSYFASRINSHRKRDDILWDVAANCISLLHFEDCVIYLLDPERKVLVQKAAYGPKMKRDLTINDPIEIPVGKGIVGAVARSGEAQLIPNTELDERYIRDDARRYSELAVPMSINNQVIGVIDSEHSKKNFFTQRHLNILTTIAVLCANQIERAKAEEEKQHAKIEALRNRQQMAESRLQSLRLQMNPHFLFNALNSIQQMILSNEEMVATRYLSRFSKLLRTILVHSDKEMVTLKEELDILNLYVGLESVRFKDSFQYSIGCDPEIDLEEVKLPTLLVQPFVENAIWHGLMHKEGQRQLTIYFSEREEMLVCVVEDNGVGRETAKQANLASGKDKSHTSKGIEVSMERLRALHKGAVNKPVLQIIDLKDRYGRPAGTRVEIIFPILND
ncbi:MAG: histidine kinase [Williamsia sp.]|nr:histidine kinase [Williamsia sp.]